MPATMAAIAASVRAQPSRSHSSSSALLVTRSNRNRPVRSASCAPARPSASGPVIWNGTQPTRPTRVGFEPFSSRTSRIVCPNSVLAPPNLVSATTDWRRALGTWLKAVTSSTGSWSAKNTRMFSCRPMCWVR